MEEHALLRTLLALAFVLGLVGVLAWALRRWGASQFAAKLQEGRRLKLLEQLYLDPKRKLVLVKCDEREHLILLSEQQVMEIGSQGRQTE